MGAFDGEKQATSEKTETVTKYTKPIIWISSHISEYHQTIWADTIINIQVYDCFVFESIINIGHRGTGNVFFRWCLLSNNKETFLGLTSQPENSTNNNYTFGGWCVEINSDDEHGIKSVANKTAFILEHDKLINYSLCLQIKHVGSDDLKTRFNTSFSTENVGQNGYVTSSITLHQIEQMKMTEYGYFKVDH